MSGRLTILPKKSYCPWNQENVERVLRDERLERERLEREAKETRAAGDERRRQRREGVDPAAGTDNGHINLFPEAKEAELRLSRGQANANSSKDAKDASGVLPVPLGGDEASKRKTGAVPFYMRSKDKGRDGEKYDNTSGSFRLGDNRGRNGRAGAAVADEITGKIMRDQYERREDGRKEKMDPMARFFGSAASSGSTVATRPTDEGVPNNRDDTAHQRRHQDIQKSRHKRRKKGRKRRSGRSRDEDDSVDSDSGASYSSSSSSSSSCSASRSDESSAHSGRRRHRRRKEAKHKSQRQRKSRRSCSEERHSRKRSKKRHRKESRKRHDGRGSTKDRLAKRSNSQACAEDTTLEELRRRRHAREVREVERERQLLRPNGVSPGAGSGADRGHHYHDQFNPMLSRN